MQRRAYLAGRPAFITTDIGHENVSERRKDSERGAVHDVRAQGASCVHWVATTSCEIQYYALFE